MNTYCTLPAGTMHQLAVDGWQLKKTTGGASAAPTG